MALSHVLSSPIADFTGTVTVFNSAGATTTANATQIVRPSDWNSAHNIFLTLSGNTSGASTMSGTNIVYQGGNNVTLSANGASLIFSAASQTVQTQNMVSVNGSTGAIVFSNSNNVTFGNNASTITASASFNQTAQTQSNVQGIVVSNTTYRTGDVSFGNLNGISFGSNGANVVTASYTVPTQTNQQIGAYAVSNTTQSSSGTIDARSLSFRGAGVVSVGVSNGSVVISANAAAGDGVNIMAAGTRTAQTSGTILWSNLNGVSFGLNTTGGSVMTASVAAQTNQTMGLYASSQTTGQSSSSTLDARSLSMVGAGIISVGLSAGSFYVSGPDTTSFAVQSVGMSTGGNTAGDTGFGTDRLVLAGGANITLSGSTNAGSMTISVVGEAGGGGGVAISAGTQSVSTGTMVFSNSNNISFGMSGSSRITASYNFNVSAGTTSGDVNSIVFSNSNGVSFGLNGSTVTASHNAITTARASTDAIGLNTAQTNVTWTVNSSGLSFNAGGYAGTSTGFTGANISASITHNTLGIAMSMSVAAPGAAAESNAINLLGANTAGNTTATGSTLGFSGVNLTLSGTNASQIVFSAPATSSLVAGGDISISSNGSTITISRTKGTKSGISPYADLAYEMTQIGQGVMIIDPMPLPDVQFDRVVVPIYNTNSSNSSGSHTLSFWAGLYSRNASTLSLYGSASASFAITQSGTAGIYSSVSGLRALTFPWTTTIADGQYWFALVSRTTSGGADGSYSHLRQSAGIATNFLGMFSAATNASMQITLGQGSYSATTSGMPVSIGFSQIQGTGQSQFRAPIVWFASSTV